MGIMTSTDVLKMNNSSQLVGVIDDVVKEVPEIGFFAASPVTRNSYKTLAVTGLPTVAFREPSGLRTFDSVTLETRDVACKYLDASWTLPVAVAQQSDWGENEALALEQRAHLKAAFVWLAKQIWTGTSNDANGFVGLDAFIDAVKDGNDNKEMVVTANASAADASSVYAVRTGFDSCQLAWGSHGKFDEGEVQEQMLYTQTTESSVTTTAGAWHFAQKLGGWVGLQTSSKYAAAKIEKLSATSGSVGLDDDLLYELIEKFPAGMKPNGLFMNRRSFSQLRQSRTAYNTVGAPAPYPTEFEGIPIYVTDAIA